MDLLYQVSSETIEEIIERKRSKIRGLEADPLKYNNEKERINELHREINLLYVMRYKLGEIYQFIQDLDKK